MEISDFRRDPQPPRKPPVKDFSDVFPHFRSVGELRFALKADGVPETNRLFSLCEDPNDCVDVVVDDVRYFFYPATETDSENYDLLEASSLPVLPRATSLPESPHLTAVEVPRGAKSLSRILFSVEPQDGTNFGDIFFTLGHSLRELEVRTGQLPRQLHLDKIAYHGEEGQVFFVPPLDLAEGGQGADLIEGLRADLEARGYNIEPDRAIASLTEGMAA